MKDAPQRRLLSRPRPSPNQHQTSISVSPLPTPTSTSSSTPSPSLELAPTPSAIWGATVAGEQVSGEHHSCYHAHVQQSTIVLFKIH
jgi:hypothetical protein